MGKNKVKLLYMGESFGFPHEILYNMLSLVTEITTSGYNKMR